MSKLVALSLLVLCSFTLPSCSREKSQVISSVENYLKGFGARDVKFDLYQTAPDVPDTSYVGVTITWNFAGPDGQPQKEWVGYIVRMVDQQWKVDKSVQYTTDPEKAKQIIRASK
jgi:hypothetical protein